ncbi:MAG TPA: two-component regulator propeller domain-containing protein [Rhodothermales bacterium]|nr:two-component regulator propeller domain-containing protein [Rhodothermales bacterium]
MAYVSLRGILTFWLLALMVHTAAAQDVPGYSVHSDYVVQQWTVRDGLPNNSINDLLVASDGFIWLATNEGLVRFDGTQFTVFNSTNTPELPSNRFNTLVEEPEGYLWTRSEKADLNLYHKGRFTGFKEKVERDFGFLTLPVSAYGVGDTVLIGSRNGVMHYTADGLEPFRPDVISGPVRCIKQDTRGRLWVVVQNKGLYRFEQDGTFRLFTPEDGFDFGEGFQLFEDPAGRMWTKTSTSIVRVDGDTVETIIGDETRIPNSRLQLIDAEGTVWISSLEEGWWGYDAADSTVLIPKPGIVNIAKKIIEGPDGDKWQTGNTVLQPLTLEGDDMIFRDLERIFSIRDNITNLAFDDQGTLWIGTLLNGLFRVRRSVFHTLSEADGLPKKQVYPILEDQEGAIWVGTFGAGLVRFDTAMRPTVFEPDSTLPAHVMTLHEDDTGTVWVGGLGSVCRMQGNRCEKVHLPNTTTRAIYEDRQARLWIGTHQGLYVGPSDDPMGPWLPIQSNDGLPQSWVRTILEAHDGTLFFGTNGDGLLRYDENGGFDLLSTDHDLPSNLIRDLYEDLDGLLWIALEDQGLCRLDRQDHPTLAEGELKCLDSRNGLYQSGLHRIIEDDDGRFWFNTNNGIFWVERHQLQAFFAGEIPAVTSVSYTEAEGMRNREGNGGMQPAGIKTHDGRLWFPTQDGVVIIDPSDVPLPAAPSVILENAHVRDEVRPVADGLELGAGERDVSFQYAALEFNRPEDVRFQYWLEGYDTAWRDGGNQRSATYTNLSPGTYTFHVRAGVGGIWSEAVNLNIKRAPFFWETRWFLAVLGLFVISGGVGIYSFRVRQLKAREAELEEVVHERTTQLAEKATELERANELKSRFLANISHEFRTPLTLTFGPLNDLLTGRFRIEEAARPHLERAQRNGHRLLRLINQLLELARLDAGALHLEARRDDLAQHLRDIAALFQDIARQHRLCFTVDVPAEPVWHVFDADKVENVVVNLLSNAIKFTPPDGAVSLRLVQEDDGTAHLTVSDKGQGIPEAHLPHLFDRFYQVDSAATRRREGSGIGLALVKELVALHEGRIMVESTPGVGTRFDVFLPVLEVSAAPAPTATDDSLHALPTALPQATFLAEDLNRAHTEDKDRFSAPDLNDTVVLVVEDNADMRAYIRAHLEADYHVVEATHGTAGLALAQEWVPDLVLSDVMMPEMDGLELCAALKKDVRTSHIPVTLLTAKAEVEHRIAGFESGADAYLPKPFDAEELRVRVRTLIEERRRLRLLFGPAEEATAGDAARPVLPPQEAAFLAEVETVLEEHLSDATFGVDQLAEAVYMSRRQLLRKLKALTDESPSELLSRARMAKAGALLREGFSAKEVAYEVGFKSYSSFSRAFKSFHGTSPSVFGQET